MPQYDLYHEPVKHALIKDGWIITDDPFVIEFGVRQSLLTQVQKQRLLHSRKGHRC